MAPTATLERETEADLQRQTKAEAQAAAAAKAQHDKARGTRATSRTTGSSHRSTSPAAESADAGFATSKQTPRTQPTTKKGKHNQPLPTPQAPATNLQTVESHSASKAQAEQPGEPEAALEPAANEQQQQQQQQQQQLQQQQQGQAEQHIDEPQAGLQQAAADQLAQKLDAVQQQLNADQEAENIRPDPIAL